MQSEMVLAEALSAQINAEYYSAYLYLSMSSAAVNLGLKGFSNWLFVQAQEELAHGTNIFNYMLDRGSTPKLTQIAEPPNSYASIGSIFSSALKHEQSVTKSINSIATLAMKEGDHACYQFLMWYVNEQVEEEATFTDIIDRLNLIGDNKGMLLPLDNELGTRVFVNPFPAKNN